MCPPGGDAISLNQPHNNFFGPARATWLSGGQSAPRALSSRAVGLRPDGSLISSARSTRRTGTRESPEGPMRLAVETLGQGARVVSTLSLEPAAFAGIGDDSADRLDYATGRPLADGTMVVAAGFRPSWMGQFDDGRVRALFRIDVEARTIVRTSQASLSVADQASVFGAAAAQTSPDGALYVAARTKAPSVEVVGIRVADSRRTFTATLPNARQAVVVSFDRTGGLVAIGTLSPDGRSGVIRTLDARTGATSWTSPPLRGTPILAEAMPDGSWVVASSECQAVRIDGATGAVRWNVTTPGC